MTDTIRLRELIDSRGLKLKWIAEQMNLTPYGLAKKISNENEFRASEIQKLCDLLGVSDTSEKERLFFAQKGELNSPDEEVTNDAV